MRIAEITERNAALIQELLKVWESSPVGFMGFQVYKRTELDEQGNPYPLLYMKRD